MPENEIDVNKYESKMNMTMKDKFNYNRASPLARGMPTITK